MFSQRFDKTNLQNYSKIKIRMLQNTVNSWLLDILVSLIVQLGVQLTKIVLLIKALIISRTLW